MKKKKKHAWRLSPGQQLSARARALDEVERLAAAGQIVNADRRLLAYIQRYHPEMVDWQAALNQEIISKQTPPDRQQE